MKLILRYALYITIGVVIWTLVEFLLGLHNEHIQTGKVTGVFSFIIPITLLYLGIKAKRDRELNGSLSFMEGLKTGSGISLVTAIFMASFFLFYLKVLNPAAVDALIAAESQIYLEKGSLDYTEIKRILDMVEFAFSTTGILIWSFVPPLFGGVVLSAFYAKILQQKVQLGSNGDGL